jgi:hypothetical protein
VASITGKDVSAFADMVSAKDIVIEPLFGISEERIEARAAMMTAASPEVAVLQCPRPRRETG